MTARQLALMGLTPDAVVHRVRTGLFTRLHHGVYMVGPLKGMHADAMAAVLASGPGAVVSHHAAAALWGLVPGYRGPIDVTIADGNRRSRTGVRVHRRRLEDRDIARHHGIPVTAPARTLIDLATLLPTRDLERAVNEALVRRLTTHGALDATVAHHAGRPGAPALRAALHLAPALTRSEAERRLRALVARAQLPHPRMNTRVEGHEVDALWPRHRLIVEVDGRRFHDTPARFERDRARDARLAAAGYVVVRVTWRQLTTQPEAVVARLAAALARR